MAEPCWSESGEAWVLVMPVTRHTPPTPAETDIFANGSSDTCGAHQCSISQKAILCGPPCVKSSCGPHVFVTQQQKHKMLRSHTAGEEGLLLSGEPALTAPYFSPLLSLLLYHVFQAVNTHGLIKARCLVSARRCACCEAACQGLIPHCMCPAAPVVPQ